MCLILRGRVENLLKLDLEYAERRNADGFGIHCPNQVLYSFDVPGKRSSSIRSMLQTLGNDTLATVHFRLATHGRIDRSNAHPFHVSGDVFLMHNGVLRDDCFQCPNNQRSDTAMLALALSDKPYRDRCDILHSLAFGNRFCLLKGSKWRKFGDWRFDKETCTWHSNGLLLTSDRDRFTCDPRKSVKGLFDSCAPRNNWRRYDAPVICDICDKRISSHEGYMIDEGIAYCEACEGIWRECNPYDSLLQSSNPDDLHFEDFQNF